MANLIPVTSDAVVKLLVRRGTDADRQNVVLTSGEIGYTIDTKRIFIGDGITPGGNLVGNINFGIQQGIENFTGIAYPGDLIYQNITTNGVLDNVLYSFNNNQWSNIHPNYGPAFSYTNSFDNSRVGFLDFNPSYFYLNTTNKNLGIGNTNPNNKLTVTGTISASDNILISGRIGVGTYTPNKAVSVVGTVSAYAYRANQGVPTNTDNSINGFAFGDDGDTGMFSPVNVVGPANGIIALYTNNQEALRIIRGGNVGIGTQTPNANLTVVGNVSATNNVFADSAHYGAGGWKAPGFTLTVNGMTSATGDINTGGNIFLSTNNKSLLFRDSNGGTPKFSMQADNKFVFYGTNSTGNNRAVFTTYQHSDNSSFNIFPDGSGYVGVRTSDPLHALSVRGSISATENVYFGPNGLSVGAGTGANVSSDSSNLALRPTAGALVVQNNAGTSTSLYVDTKTTSNVGIGTVSPNAALTVSGSISSNNTSYFDRIGIRTSTPNSELTVNGVISATGGIWSNNLLAVGSKTNAFIYPTNANSNLYLGAANTSYAVINGSTGNVGIGTDSEPTQRLEVANGNAMVTSLSTPTLYINSIADKGWKGAVRFLSNYGPKWEIGVDPAANGTNGFYFYDNVAAATRAYIDPEGNFGIGGIDPTATLHVARNFGNNNSTGIAFQVDDTNTNVRHFAVNASGRVSVGADTFDNANLTVNGTVTASNWFKGSNFYVTPTTLIPTLTSELASKYYVDTRAGNAQNVGPTITTTWASVGQATVYAGSGLVNGINTLNFKTLSAGRGVTIFDNGTDTIALTAAAGGFIPKYNRLEGDGTTRQFLLNAGTSTNAASYRVDIDGVLQEPTVDYTIPSTPYILFTVPPYAGAKIVVIAYITTDDNGVLVLPSTGNISVRDSSTINLSYDVATAVLSADFVGSLQASSVPPGVITYYVGPNRGQANSISAPSGWLKANGAAVSRTTYSALFAIISTTYGAGDGSTTFNLPDLRGQFIRSWADDATAAITSDVGRLMGSTQADDNKSHTHTVVAGDDVQHPSSGGFAYSLVSSGSHAEYNIGIKLDTLTTSSAGGTETRPANTALLAIIKY